MNKPTLPPALLASVRALLDRRDGQPLPTGHTRPEVKVTAQAGAGSELMLYDEISYWGITAVDVAAALAGVKGDLHVRVNSPGGDVFDGIAIYNMLADHPGRVTVTVDGLAASAASFIAQAGDEIRMNRGAQMMIHDASGLCIGNASEMTAMAALLDQVSGTLADIYAARTGSDAETWRSRMRGEAWFTAEQAVEVGLADAMVPHPAREAEEPESYAATLRSRLVAALYPYAARSDQAPAPVPCAPVAAVAQSPAAGEPAPAPEVVEPAEGPDSTDEDDDEDLDEEPAAAPPDEPDPGPDEWASAVADLITPPSTEDVWESLREALL